MKTRPEFLTALDEFFNEMSAGDVILITKRIGGKFVVTSISGDGYTVTGHGDEIEKAWDAE